MDNEILETIENFQIFIKKMEGILAILEEKNHAGFFDKGNYGQAKLLIAAIGKCLDDFVEMLSERITPKEITHDFDF